MGLAPMGSEGPLVAREHLECSVLGLGYRVWGFEPFRLVCLGFRVSSLGFRTSGLGFRV